MSTDGIGIGTFQQYLGMRVNRQLYSQILVYLVQRIMYDASIVIHSRALSTTLNALYIASYISVQNALLPAAKPAHLYYFHTTIGFTINFCLKQHKIKILYFIKQILIFIATFFILSSSKCIFRHISIWCTNS